MDNNQTPVLLDERLEFRGPSFLRTLSAEKLADLDKVIVIQDGPAAERLAVIMSYSAFLVFQKLADTKGS